jgi:hypothetical protein
MLDSNTEQMIIKSSTASNHELIKKIEQSNGQYLIDAFEHIAINEFELLAKRT